MHRKTVFPELVSRRMASLEPEIAEIAVGCAERALRNRNVDFMAEIGNVVPITMISRLIGFRGSDLDLLLRARVRLDVGVGGPCCPSTICTAGRAHRRGQTWIADQLATAVGQ